MSAEEPTLSKSARKRANKKARDAEGGEEEAAPAAPEPKAKAKAKAEPKAAPAPAPKAEAKAKAAPEKSAAEPKSKAKAKAKPKEEAAEQAPKAAPKPEAKPKPKASSKGAAKPKQEEPKAEPKPKQEENEGWVQYDDGKIGFIDDGKGGDWEEASGLSKKAQKQKAKKEEAEAMAKQMQKAGVVKVNQNQQHIPGMATQADIMQAAKTEAKGKAVSQAAVAVVSAAAADSKGKEPEKAAPDNSTSATVKIPDNKIGWVIGPKGATIAMIKEKTGVKTIDTSGGVCTIVGDKEGVGLAEHAVKELIEKGFTSLAFDNFQEFGIMVHPCHFPFIIGEKGCIIQAIKKEAKCEVAIPEVPKNAHPDKKFKLTLSGAAASVELGKEIINSIVTYGHHEITHPGFVHKEIEVADWQYKYLIGTKGSEMRHIQNSFHVKVNIPRAHSTVQNVVVVGEPQDIEKACKHIEKTLWNADQPKGRGQQETSIDPWGEDEVEDWMSPYLYKRK